MNKEVKDFLLKMVSDETGPSSKRIIFIIGSLCVFTLMCIFRNTIFVDASTIIICASLGITGAVSIFGKK